MCPASAERVNELLHNWGHGDQSAREELIPLVYAELRRSPIFAKNASITHFRVERCFPAFRRQL